jgi:hypothetical protein
MRYTSIAKVFTFLPKSFAEEDGFVLEYASQAMDALGIHQVYDKKTCLIKITDHQASLPSDCKFVQALTYMHNQPTEDSINTLISTSKSTEDNGTTTTDTYTTLVTTTSKDYYNKDTILRIQHQGVLNNYKLWAESDVFTNNFSLLRLVNRSVNINVHCDNCPNLICESKDYYQINMNNQIMTSIKDGYLCLFYLAKKKNDRGEFLIPDNFDVLTALAAYVKYKFMEDMAFSRQKGYQSMYREEQMSWEILSAKVKGQYILQDFTSDDIENYGNYLSKIFHNSNAFDNHKY